MQLPKNSYKKNRDNQVCNKIKEQPTKYSGLRSSHRAWCGSNPKSLWDINFFVHIPATISHGTSLGQIRIETKTRYKKHASVDTNIPITDFNIWAT